MKKVNPGKQNSENETTGKSRLSRTRSIGNLYAKKYKVMELGGVWLELLGEVEQTGCWLIWGIDKNGKTRLAAMLAKYLCEKNRVLYVSAEEGDSLNFNKICRWAGFTPGDRKFQIIDYVELAELKQRLTGRNAPNIVFIDNITFYHDELKYGGVRQLLSEFKKTVFVFIAHEQGGEPYTSTAKMVSKLAAVRMRVQGLKCLVSGRVPGGSINIDEKGAGVYHGEERPDKNNVYFKKVEL